MRLLEKLVWALGALVIAALVLVMVFWKPSPIPTTAIPVERVSSKSRTGRKSLNNRFSVPESATAGKSASGGSGSTSRSTGKGTGRSAYKYPVKAAKFKPEDYKVGHEFREKYGSNFREVWEALQTAEAEFVLRPDGTKVARIVSIEKDSIIERLGFAVGDEIYAVNGRNFSEFDESSMKNMYNEGSKLYDQLKEETEFQIELERAGSPMVLTYYIPK